MAGKKGANARPLWDRFHEKLVIDEKSGCWLWTGALGGRDNRSQIGAGIDRPDGPTKKVIGGARAAWILYRGAIPAGVGVLHTCDDPRCVNPDHLFLGTQLDNMQDCKKKGRLVAPDRRQGVEVHNAKLTPAAILDIRSRGRLQKEYAAQYGICQQTVSDIWRGRSWGWLPDSIEV